MAKSTYLWMTVDYQTKLNKYRLKFPDSDKLVLKGHKREGNELWTTTRPWLREPPRIVNRLRWVLIDQLAGKTRGNSGSQRKNWMRMRNPFSCFFSVEILFEILCKVILNLINFRRGLFLTKRPHMMQVYNFESIWIWISENSVDTFHMAKILMP